MIVKPSLIFLTQNTILHRMRNPAETHRMGQTMASSKPRSGGRSGSGGRGNAPPLDPGTVVTAIVEGGAGAYLLLGDNGVDQEEVVAMAVDKLTQAETRPFNYDDYDASDREVTGEIIVSAVRSFPMLADHRVVVLRNMEGAREDVGNELVQLVEDGIEGTVLIMSGVKLDGRRKWAQALSKKSTKFMFEVPRPRMFPVWLKQRAESVGGSISEEAAQMLLDYVGMDIWRAASELGKVLLYILPRTDIEIEDVAAAVGLTREDTVYNLTDCIAEQKSEAALAIARRMVGADAHPAYLVGAVVRHWQSLRLASDVVGTRRQHELSDLLGDKRRWILDKYTSQARTLQRERIRNGFRLALAAESAIKSGWEPSVVLDGLICQLAAPGRS
jgi:DNA polymerase III subunit delta